MMIDVPYLVPVWVRVDTEREEVLEVRVDDGGIRPDKDKALAPSSEGWLTYAGRQAEYIAKDSLWPEWRIA